MLASRTQDPFAAALKVMADCADSMEEVAEKEPAPVQVTVPVTVQPAAVTVVPGERPKFWTFEGVINGKPFKFTGNPNY